MDSEIAHDAGLTNIDYHFERPVDCISHAETTAYMLVNIEKALIDLNPDILLVCGDANTNLAGALAARKLHIKVGHVESGLRSFDWRMPEEHNRVMIDHISEYLFATTTKTKRHLIDDGVAGEIFVVGNTIIDATLNNLNISKDLYSHEIGQIAGSNNYFVLTSHREENVDNRSILTEIVNSILKIVETFEIICVFPVHPRTEKYLKKFGLMDSLINNTSIKIITPLSYFKFLTLLDNAQFVMTDSGGLQEESCILNVPCLTIRENTERQETVEIGANRIVGTNIQHIIQSVEDIIAGRFTSGWLNPYGDGKTSKKIVDVCVYGNVKE